MTITLPLHTQRLTLRLHQENDLEVLLGIYADEDVARYLLDEPWTRDVAREQFAKRLRRTGLDAPARALALVIEHDGAVVGDIALWLTDDTGRKAEIGWVISPDASGQGIATEAARALRDEAFADEDLHRIEAQLDARNHASARVCERIGMRREGLMRQNWWSKGEWTDTLIYGSLSSDR